MPNSLISDFKRLIAKDQEGYTCVSFTAGGEEVFRLVGLLGERGTSVSKYIQSGLMGGLMDPPEVWKGWRGSAEAEGYISKHGKERVVVTVRLPVGIAVALRTKSEYHHISQSDILREMVGFS